MLSWEEAGGAAVMRGTARGIVEAEVEMAFAVSTTLEEPGMDDDWATITPEGGVATGGSPTIGELN